MLEGTGRRKVRPKERLLLQRVSSLPPLVGVGNSQDTRAPAGAPQHSHLACPIASRSAARRQVPASASPIARAGVRIGRAKSINARHAREALLLRGVAAVDPAMAGAVICAPAAVSAGASCGQG